eukprot:7583-Heterococcus_DN1.PRE.2
MALQASSAAAVKGCQSTTSIAPQQIVMQPTWYHQHTTTTIHIQHSATLLVTTTVVRAPLYSSILMISDSPHEQG